MYAIDPIGEFKRALSESVRNGLTTSREFLSKVKGIPGEMIHILLADQQTANNLRWRTQQNTQKTTRSEKWDAQLQLFSLKQMLRRGDVSAFRKRLGDFGWQQPEDLALLVGRSQGQILSSHQLKKSDWWGWYLVHVYDLARRHQNVAQWNELLRYLERYIKTSRKKGHEVAMAAILSKTKTPPHSKLSGEFNLFKLKFIEYSSQLFSPPHPLSTKLSEL
ncbi:MAG: hypothetical protein ACRCZE_02390 [Candidatus Altimarinota bacterium]